MRAEGLRLAVGSSSEPDELAALLSIAGTTKYIDAQISAGDLANLRPNLDIVHASLDKLHLNANEVILIGDTPYDIEVASKADVQVIAFRCGGWHDHDLKGAIAIYDSPADLLSKYQTSPFAMNGVQIDETPN